MVPAEVWANLPPDPEITALEEQRAELKQGQYRFQGREDEAKIRALTDVIRSKRAQRDKQIVKEYREFYFYNRGRVADILCHQPKDLSDEQMFQRTIEVIDLYMALCGKRETVKRNRTPPTAYTEPPTTLGFITPEVEFEPASDPSSDPFPLMNANQCPECFGDERLTLGERAFRYSRPTKEMTTLMTII
ncbi:hypothetical protein QQZ08_010867 [Neonectria magnoliae]|uniref:Uncharacterized protein n=1 Tax=Neonectria magnoliae TaxID=2732573 RepID=A0ABR1HF34_9HYPO